MNKYNESKERINIIVGMRLKKRRIMLGISQQELSEAINLSVKQIQKIEYFLDMTKTTEVSEDYLFGTQDNNSLVNNIIAEDKAEYLVPLKYDTEKEVSYLVEGFTEIQNPQIRQKIVELIKSIVASQGNQV